MCRAFILLAVIVFASACERDVRTVGGETGGAENDAYLHAPTADECEADWAGPWTSCPQADWIGSVAEDAGYRIAGETGSALVAEGKGHGFYLWTSDAHSDLVESAGPRWKAVGRVHGVPIYGDRHVWTWWVVEEAGVVIWLNAGPHTESRLPKLDELEPLVVSSKMIRPTW